MAKQPNTRAIASQILTAVIVEGNSLSTALDQGLKELSVDRDKAFVQALCYGAVRWYYRLDLILGRLLKKPFKAKDSDIRILALLGLYQLGFSAVKPYAAVSETVSAAPRKPWAKPLLNAVLRAYQRDQKAYNDEADLSPVGASAHPQWLIDEIRNSWPNRYEEILRRGNDKPPMTLRVNCAKKSRDGYVGELQQRAIVAVVSGVCESAVTLTDPMNVDRLPGFSQGLVSVQDEAAQLAAFLLKPRPGERILDACAAPGGKTLHLLERCPELAEVVAVDVDSSRLRRIQENLQRSDLNATLLTADVSIPAEWWDGQLFDRILVDVPCSATGAIRRHPDIKILRRPTDIHWLQQSQRKILSALWPLLKQGGVMLYATCSILTRENEAQMCWFSASYADAELMPIEASWGLAGSFGRRIPTGESGMDGFYYALMRKKG